VFTVNVYWFWVKVAVNALFPVIDTVSGLLEPEASPLQPEKLHPAAGVAVSWTVDPEAYDAWSGLLETVPWPTVETVNVYWIWVNVAVTALFPLIVTVAGFADPERPPLQPAKT
jgi:hypothetical protein